MIFFLTLCIVVYMGGALLMTLPYWYETGNTPSEDIPALPFTVRNVIRLWLESAWIGLFLVLANLAHPVAALLRSKKEPPETTRQNPPLLLVHGLYHNNSAWLFLQPYLRKAGFTRIHAFTYSSRNATINGIVDQMEAFIADMEARYKNEKPIALGHSLGGVLIRAWMAKSTNASRLGGVITLGTPHKGSKTAALAPGRLGKAIMPSNPLFTELARKEKKTPIPCLALVSEGDNMILPQDNLVPPSPGWTLRLTPFTTHVGLLVRSSVLRMTAWELFRMAGAARMRSATPPTSAETPQQPPVTTPLVPASKAMQKKRSGKAEAAPSKKSSPKRSAGKTKAVRSPAAKPTEPEKKQPATKRTPAKAKSKSSGKSEAARKRTPKADR